MSKALTSIAIDNLKPHAARYEVPDGGQRGLLLVVFPSGKKSLQRCATQADLGRHVLGRSTQGRSSGALRGA